MSKIIEVHSLTKKFPATKNTIGFKEWIVNLPRFTAQNSHPYFTALKSITFSVEKGECLGVIGKNGAGKSSTGIENNK